MLIKLYKLEIVSQICDGIFNNVEKQKKYFLIPWQIVLLRHLHRSAPDDLTRRRRVTPLHAPLY